MNINLKPHMNIKDQLLRKSPKTKKDDDIQSYKRKRNEVNIMIKKAKIRYQKKLLNDSEKNPDTFWNSIKKIFPSKSSSKPSQTFIVDSSEINDQRKIANAFCSYFTGIVSNLKKSVIMLSDRIWSCHRKVELKTCQVFRFRTVTEENVLKHLKLLKRKKSTGLDEIPPWLLNDCLSVLSKPLAHIINISLNTSVYPTDWKRSKIITLYKKGQHNKVDNFRPISVIPAVSKIIENIVHQQLSDYLEDNNLLDDDQYGFRRK